MDIILHNRGHYQDLLTFKKATVIYDLTYYFCHRYLSPGDRTIDQMVQAARSGKQNIAEGVSASATNAETEIRLLNVAKASFQELLVDFEDYLRVHNLTQWEKNGKEIAWLKNFTRAHADPVPYLEIIKSRDDAVAANLAAALIKQEDYLLHRQLKAAEAQYREKGDLRVRARPAARETKERLRDAAMREAKTFCKRCPSCGGETVDGTTSRNGEMSWKWRCVKCGAEIKTDPIEMMQVRAERSRRIMAVKRIYGY
ncbi:MAG: four helix bundle protein [Kiritimatiellae bacterium]|nr:four helix bundle protein [Kiritimatiellia bacterium]